MIAAGIIAGVLPLIHAHSFIATMGVGSVMALIMFALDGAVVWSVGAVMAAGSIVGGMLGARVAGSASAKKWVFRLLAAVILGELANLGVRYFFHTA